MKQRKWCTYMPNVRGELKVRLEFGSWRSGADRGGNGLRELGPEPFGGEDELQPSCSEWEPSHSHSAEYFAASHPVKWGQGKYLLPGPGWPLKMWESLWVLIILPIYFSGFVLFKIFLWPLFCFGYQNNFKWYVA